MAPLALTFRKATSADAPAIRNLVLSAYRGESSRAGWTTEADLVADERIDIEGVVAKITEPNGRILMAHDREGGLVACCELLRRDSGGAYFGLFAVDPTRQAGGIGRQVLERAEAFAKEEWGVTQMEMQVIWTREELIAWYMRRGYRKTEKRVEFPYAELVNGKALRDDLYFITLDKQI